MGEHFAGFATSQRAIAVSHAVQQDAQMVVSNLPVELIYNGIDTDEFSPGSAPGFWLDQLANLTPGGPETIRIGLVATYAAGKVMKFLEIGRASFENPAATSAAILYHWRPDLSNPWITVHH